MYWYGTSIGEVVVGRRLSRRVRGLVWRVLQSNTASCP